MVNQAGTIFLEDKNANGMDTMDPMMVPRKAIAAVSNNKYGTPVLVVKSKRNGRLGVNTLLIILNAISIPVSVKPFSRCNRVRRKQRLH